MATRTNRPYRKAPRTKSTGRRYRRLALERVEDRTLLAAVAFQGGIESQFSPAGNSITGGTLPAYVGQPITLGNTAAASIGQVTANGAVVIPLSAASSFANGSSAAYSSSGRFVLIGSGNLPSPPSMTPIALPTPPSNPIDIGSIVGIARIPPMGPQPAPPVIVAAPARSPDVGPAQPPAAIAPVTDTPLRSSPATVVGDSPSPVVKPASDLHKPDVEGSGGKSQVLDVATSDGNASTSTSPVSVAAAAAETPAEASSGATPSAADVVALMRETAQAGASNSVRAPIQAAEANAAIDPGVAVRATESAPSERSALVISQAVPPDEQPQPQAEAAADPAPAAVAVAVLSDDATTAPTVSAATPEKPAGSTEKPLFAGIGQRANIFGAAILAFVGQYTVQRWRKTSLREPQAIVLRRKRLPSKP